MFRENAMCGIAGLIDWRAATGADALRSIGEAMNDTLRHRGPDGSGVWVEAEGGAALCQRRLAIIDLSPGGAQPMHSADRRYVITFNGEIYNYRDIRAELAAAGRTDAQRLRHRSAARSLRALGRGSRRSSAPSACSPSRCGIVRRGPCIWRATVSASSRSITRRRAERVLFASELKALRAVPGLAADDRRRCGRRLPAPRLHRAAAHHLSRSLEASARSYPDAAPGRGAGAAMLLGPARHRHRRPGAQRSGS